MRVLVASETSCESGSVCSHSLLMLILRQVFSEMTEGVVITITSTYNINTIHSMCSNTVSHYIRIKS